MIGISFRDNREHDLSNMEEIRDADEPVSVKINGHDARQVPGPQGLPLVGSYLEGA